MLESSRSLETPSSLQVAVKHVAVILINFQNNTSTPYTHDFIRQTTFTNTAPTYSVNAYYQENSFGTISLEGTIRADGDVYGYYTIPYDNTSCSTLAWRSSAIQAARADGFDPAGYDSIVYSFGSSWK